MRPMKIYHTNNIKMTKNYIQPNETLDSLRRDKQKCTNDEHRIRLSLRVMPQLREEHM